MSFEDIHRPLGQAGFRGTIRVVILLSGLCFILQQIRPGWVLDTFGLVPARVLEMGWAWQVFTYAFLHGGLFHWLFNMFVFWMFGRELEVRWGTPRFVRYCLVTLLGAAICVLAVSPHSTVPTVGSSGVVFGLLVAFAMTFPQAVMYLYFLIPMKAWQVAVLFGVIELLTLAGQEGGPAPWAHLGGMASGYLYLKALTLSGIGWNVPWLHFGRLLSKTRPDRRVKLEEITDDLASEVDQILDKILKQGVESLTESEKKLMDRYARRKK